jgi:hypothetical protein
MFGERNIRFATCSFLEGGESKMMNIVQNKTRFCMAESWTE